MTVNQYVIIDDKTKKVNKKYAVIDGKTRKITKEYVVVDGKTRLCWSGGENKKFIHRYQTYSPNYVYALASEDFTSWSDSKQIGTTFYGGMGTIYGSSIEFKSLLFNDKYYFISSDKFQYTSDGVNFTTYANNFNPISSFNFRDITVIDGKFYAVYQYLNSHYTISIYTSTDLVNWTLVTSFDRISHNGNYNYLGDIRYIQLFKGKFLGKERYVLFYRYYNEPINSSILISDDCVTWDYIRTSSGSVIGYSWSNVCIADDGIYYTTFYDNNSDWYLKNPNGVTVAINTNLNRREQCNLFESISDKNYLIISIPYSGMYKLPKTGGTATRIYEPIFGNFYNNQRRLAKSTKLTTWSTTSGYSSYSKVGYCTVENQWTYKEVSVNTSILSNELIYD